MGEGLASAASGSGPALRLAHLTAPFVAVLVGFGGAVVLSACRALGASEVETVSWITGLYLAMAVSATSLSFWHRMPIVTAWSTPAAALIAATAVSSDSSGITLERGVNGASGRSCLPPGSC